MGCFNCRHLDLQGTNGTILQCTGTDRADRQFTSRDDPAGKLPGRDRISLHGIRNGAEGHLCIFPGQAVIGILRHPHGYPDTDPGSDYPNGIAEEDVLQEAVFRILFCLCTVDETNIQRYSRHITPGIELGLCRIPHEGIALSLGLCIVAVGIFLGFGNRQVNPFWMGIGVDQGTVDVQFWQVQHIAICVLTGRHDPGDDIGQVNVVGDSKQVLCLPDLDVGILPDAFNDKNIPPVAGELDGSIPIRGEIRAVSRINADHANSPHSRQAERKPRSYERGLLGKVSSSILPMQI